MRTTGRRRVSRQRPAKFLDEPVGLPVVAARAGGDAVLPGMLAASAARHDVIDGVGLGAAVRAQVVVPAHQRRPGQGHPAAMRQAHVPAQPDDGRRVQPRRGGVQLQAGRSRSGSTSALSPSTRHTARCKPTVVSGS